MGATYVSDGHVSREICNLRWIARLELFKLLGGPGDQNDAMRGCQQPLGHSKANTAACAGDDDHLGCHCCPGMLILKSQVGALAGPWYCDCGAGFSLSMSKEFREPLLCGERGAILLLTYPTARIPSISPWRSALAVGVSIEPLGADALMVEMARDGRGWTCPGYMSSPCFPADFVTWSYFTFLTSNTRYH
jgi:hypothetical protein